ncbi:hypothetical protein K501DRAFT_263928 [Backusella circina FSU 941]|nr:hypothetical protein K501DRAFT_263928 [Backusella circina FSU 941]
MSEKQFNQENITKVEPKNKDKEQNNSYSSTSTSHLWEITHEQSASLQALHQSMQNAAMNSNLNPLSLAAQQQQAQMHAQSSPQMTYQQQQQQHHQQQQQPQTQDQTQPQQSDTPEQAKNQAEEPEEAKPSVGSEEWHRQRRENHKQVERRRRETINEGINEIARIVPGCEKNKGSILHRAAAYIRQLKENEASTIEKWTLEKLLTDQAINELNRQVEVLKVEMEHARQENVFLKRKLEDDTESGHKRQLVEE